MSTAMKLTKRVIDALEASGDKFRIAWDDELKGFGIRVMPSGTKTFILDYRNAHGQQRRMSIGRYGVLTPEEARKRARQMLNRVASDRDPMAERERAREAATFKELAEEYIKRRCPEIKSGREYERMIRLDILPRFGRRPVRDIKRRDVIALGEDIKARGAGVSANRTLEVVRAIFNWAIDRELCEVNPAMRVKPPSKESSRERVLTADEIRSLWKSLDKIPGSPVIHQALKFILATGQRPGEVVTAEWTEIVEDEDGAWWTIPAEKAKNGLAHRVPLSPIALEILHALPHGEAGFVFSSPVDSKGYLTRHALARLLHRQRELLSLERFTPHDLRRTTASHMASMGISRLVISKILNHVETGITAVYDRHSYDAEKRAALEAWGVKLADILEGKKTRILSIAGKGRRG